MLKHAPTILAAAVLVACTKAPSAVQSTTPAPNSPQQQLAAFRLQTACAREAREWLNERERNEGYNPKGSGAVSITFQLGKTHYSLIRHGCYAVVDEQSIGFVSAGYVFDDSHRLYEIDGDYAPLAQISALTNDPRIEDIATLLIRAVKSCSVGTQKCDSLATWNLWTRPYLEE